MKWVINITHFFNLQQKKTMKNKFLKESRKVYDHLLEPFRVLKLKNILDLLKREKVERQSPTLHELPYSYHSIYLCFRKSLQNILNLFFKT